VFWDETRGVFAVSRFADVLDIARDPARFSSSATRRQVPDRITAMDPPKHGPWRAVVADRFRARSVQRVEADLRRLARERLQDGRDAGTLDLVNDYGARIPSAIIGDMLGVPREEHPRCHELSEISIGGDPEQVAVAHAEIDAMFERVIAARRRHPADDLVTALSEARVEGRPLTQQQLLAYCLHLLVAGNDTTANLIATGAVLLAGHPELRSHLAQHPESLPSFVEEMLRYNGPTHMLPRSTTEPVTLHGVDIPEDAVIELYWAAGNRDERQFPEPDRFLLDRPERVHLAFGQGPHFCLGAHLARLEAKVAIEELLAASPEYTLVIDERDLPLKPGWSVRGFRTAPVRL
jgi:cytochrome P450